MPPSLRPIAPAAAAILLGVACSQQPKPSPSPAPAPVPTQTAQRGPARGDSTPSENPTGGRQGGQGGGAAAANGQLADPNPRPYGRVVTADAKTRNGLFKVHRINNRLLFEIPRKELDRDQLLVTEIAKTTLGVGYGGQALGNRVLRWEKRDNRVLLRSKSYEVISSDTTSPVVGAVQAANVDAILAVLHGEASGPDRSSVAH